MQGNRLALAALLSALTFAAAGIGSLAQAETITLRIATGHPPGVVYAGLMKNFFEPELKKRVEARTKHTINWVEGYSGSIVKVNETLTALRTASSTSAVSASASRLRSCRYTRSRSCCRSAPWTRRSA